MTSLQQRMHLLKQLRKANKADGFSLVELLVVIVIIGILSGVALPKFLGASDKAKVAAANASAAAIVTACELDEVSDIAISITDTTTEPGRLYAARPTDAKALVTVDTTDHACGMSVTGTAVGTAGSFVPFDAKDPAVAN